MIMNKTLKRNKTSRKTSSEKNNAKRQNAKQNEMSKLLEQRGRKNGVQPQVVWHATHNYQQAYILWLSFNFPYI